MPLFTVNLTTPIRRTFRVEQVAGMFDVPEQRLRHTLTAGVPGKYEEWTIGAIVGPSGSGKTTLARAAYGEAVYERQAWPEDRAIIDCLSEAGIPACHFPTADKYVCPTIKTIARVLTAVGLGSVPTWLKPYQVLSTGERFRTDLARAIVGAGGSGFGAKGNELTRRNQSRPLNPEPRTPTSLIVFDEFTSSLDRTVAKTLSAALARLLRSGGQSSGFRGQGLDEKEFKNLNPEPRPLNPSLRFIALTCHSDILPWLAPDWLLDLGDASGAPLLTRGRVPRPRIGLRIERVPQSLWSRFARHHYLTGGMAASATCYGAWWEGEKVRSAECEMRHEGNLLRTPHSEFRTKPPIAFCAVVAALGWKKTKRITRLVTLPEFQGLGIGSRLAESVAASETARGFRVTITASHPAILAHCSHSPRWRYLGLKKNGSTRQNYAGRVIRCSTGRAVASFEYVAEP